MKTRPRVFRVSRLLCMLLAEIIAITYSTPPIRAQAPEPKQLTISILEGEGAINNIRQRTAREAIVQVQDENHKPVAGVAVTFFLADHGASGVFANGSQAREAVGGHRANQEAKALHQSLPPKSMATFQARRPACHRSSGLFTGKTPGTAYSFLRNAGDEYREVDPDTVFHSGDRIRVAISPTARGTCISS